MEIGPLSEWITAIAEVGAVSIALFLPYFNANKEKKLKSRNLRLGIKRLTKQALMSDEEAIRKLDLFLTISFMNNSNPNDEEVFNIGREILDILNTKDGDINDKINLLLNELV
ncbi:hypothetical protein OGZ51_08460 [Lactococcus lactis]|jgi:hypothetical protein|uniref:Phage protein n=1 Tax=Lactococcus lactis TaxID=1358 RepID=A0A9X4NHI2_9LACT|nr:hypothetical protein [Lactococcus lactis]MDG4984175.1 hypothetical protein [Lactococcus lactis]